MPQTISTASPSYRPDIDGLRAVAILSVVVYHAFPDFVPGGFVGVDVFFVISGFLISSIIVSHLQQGSFRFSTFYRNRIRRLFPALGVVLAACTIAGSFLLAPGDYAELGKHLLAGAGFVANFVLWKDSGYFDSSADTKPLLHLWSLGIEEQFYFVWPLVLWLAFKRRWNVLLVTLAVLVASFAANLVAARTDPVGNFYSPATRIWELLIGAALVHLSAPAHAWLDRHRTSSNTLAILGLVAIFLAGATLSRDTAFPSWRALVPTLGAAAILTAGSRAWLNRSLLSSRAMVWVGLISYPLYLWHWPLLTFIRITGAVDSDLGRGVCAVGTAAILSWLTYRFIETPFRASTASRPSGATRKGPPSPFGFKTAGLVLSMGLLAVLGGALRQTDGQLFKGRFEVAALPPIADKNVFEQLKIYEHYDKPNTTCRDNLDMAVFLEEVCVANSKTPRVLFFGDSHAMGLYSAIFAGETRLPSVLIASPGCLMYANLSYRPPGKEWGQNCTDIARKGLEYASHSPDIDTVVVSLVRKGDHPSQRTHFYSGDAQLTELEVLQSGTAHLVDALLKSGKNVIYVLDVPYFPDTPETCQSKFLASKTDRCVIKRSEMNERFKAYFEVLDRVRKAYPHLKVLNAEDVLCKGDTCAQHDGHQYFFVDKDHLSVYGSRKVLANLLERFSEPMTRAKASGTEQQISNAAQGIARPPS